MFYPARIVTRNNVWLEFFESHIPGNVKIKIGGYQDVELDRPGLAALRQVIDDILASPPTMLR